MHLSTSSSPRRPFVVADVDEEGRPQVLLVSPAPEVVLGRVAALALVSEIVAALSGDPAFSVEIPDSIAELA